MEGWLAMCLGVGVGVCVCVCVCVCLFVCDLWRVGWLCVWGREFVCVCVCLFFV